MTASVQTYEISSLTALEEAVALLVPEYPNGMIYLRGDLGTGKTTFVSRWLTALGHTGIVTSPTYSLVNEYRIDGRRIVHADLYRLGGPDELLYLDCEDWRPEKHLIFIEWPERGKDQLHRADIDACFTLKGSVRELLWTNRPGR